MREPIFYMMVGVAGSGKSTCSKELIEDLENGNMDYVYLSSDKIRGELYGSEEDQRNPQKVFDLMNRRANDAASAGKSVIYDATNLSAKRRKHMVAQMKDKGLKTRCIICVASRDWCVERQNFRERKVPKEVIDKQIKQFEIPTKMEGWDWINIYSHIQKDPYRMNSIDYLEQIKIPHDNPHHKLNVFEHSMAVYESVVAANEEYYKDDKLESILKTPPVEKAALLHDIGKPFTKSFVNGKGEKTDIAHYYGHENAGAWFVLSSNDDLLSPRGKLRCAQLIGLHMKMHNDTWRERLKNYWSKEDPDFWRDLYILWKADEEAH